MKLTKQQRAEVEAEGMAQVRAHERRCAADRAILFGGVPFSVDHKDDRCERCKGSGEGPAGMKVLPATALHSNQCIACRGSGRRIPPEVAERQRLTYDEIIAKEA